MSVRAISLYVDKLERRIALPPEDRQALSSVQGFYRDYGAGETIIREGGIATHCILVESGLVSRAKTLEANARQIVAFHLPGDAVDLQSILYRHADHSIEAHAASRVYWVAHADLLELAHRRPVIARALWLDTLIDASIFRVWTANLGQRRASHRIMHLLLEFATRYEAIGLLTDDSFDLPLKQAAMAQALGLSLVHMNKSLQSLKRAGFLAIRGRTVTLLKKDAMIAATRFSPDYLHLDDCQIKPWRAVA